MNIEELNKSQIILLTLLVSFVTSIATGIVTVSLMDQAPTGVTRTITHVVERTVDQVKPGETKVETVVKEVPVLVTEEDLVLKAINVVSPATVLIREVSSDGKVLNTSVGSAFMISTDGRLVTAGRLVSPDKRYDIMLENKETFPVKVVAENSSDEIAILQVVDSSRADFLAKTKTISPLTFSDNLPIIGQSVIGVGATTLGSHSVAIGIISNFFNNASSTATLISTGASSEELVGGALVDIKGNVIGLNLKAGVAVGKKIITTTIDSIK